jgi:hypothetical protein
MMVLASLCFSFIVPSAATAQDRNAGNQKKITNRTGKGKAGKKSLYRVKTSVEGPPSFIDSGLQLDFGFR